MGAQISVCDGVFRAQDATNIRNTGIKNIRIYFLLLPYYVKLTACGPHGGVGGAPGAPDFTPRHITPARRNRSK